jgi:hypothetical protein
LEDPGVDGMIMLKLIFKKWDGGASQEGLCSVELVIYYTTFSASDILKFLFTLFNLFALAA